jgi:hypothetical protein
MLAINNQKGFIALTSVVIISAVIVLLMLGIFRSSIGEMWRGGLKERGEKAFSLANLCMEIALNELRNDPDGYGGVETFVFGESECKILAVEREDGIVMKTESIAEITGRIPTYTRKIQVNVFTTGSFIAIESWQEIE